MAWPPGRGGSSGGNFPTQVALDFMWKKADSEQASAILTPLGMYLNCVTAQAPGHHPSGSPAILKETQQGMGPPMGLAHNPTGSACWCSSSERPVIAGQGFLSREGVYNSMGVCALRSHCSAPAQPLGPMVGGASRGAHPAPPPGEGKEGMEGWARPWFGRRRVYGLV